MKALSILVAASVVLSTALGVWVHRDRFGLRAVAAPAPSTVPVAAGVAKAENIPIYAQGLGTVQPIRTVAIKSRIDGQIEKVLFHQGQEVKQNDLLFVLDTRPYQAALDLARANRDKDQAQLQGAQTDLARYSRLVGSGTQSRQSYDDQQATVAQLQGAVKADAAAIQTAELNLQYALIRSPIAGRTGRLMVDEGNLVQAGVGSTLVTVTQIHPIYVSFSLAQNLLDQIREAQARSPLETDAMNSETNARLATGTLSFVDNHVDAATGTIALEATFANADERLWPGEFVSVRLILGARHDAVTVPEQTVMTGPVGEYVYVIGAEDTVRRRAVTLLARQDGVAVIGSGLTAGEKIVTGGQYRLADGTRVRMEAAGSGEPDATE